MEKDIPLLANSDLEDKWYFDKSFLAEAIKQGKEKLNREKLSRRKCQELRADIETFERYIKGNFKLEPASTYKLSFPKNRDKFKDYILTRMIKQYKVIGEETIRWVIRLYEERIFESVIGSSGGTELSLQERAELTIKNYEKNSPRFLMPAKSIILDDTVKQIQAVEFYSSCCHHDSITGLSYLIINSSDEPCIFNHEVEHAIEVAFKFPTNPLYYELGPIYYEMLFNEELYKSRGRLESSDFDFRLDEMKYLLNVISSYFEIMLLFKKKNFNISTDEFIKTICQIKSIKPSFIEGYLKEEIANDNVIIDIRYLLSFLKAVELREVKINNPQAELLEPYIKSKKFNFEIPQDGFKVYDRYIEEMNQKVKKKINIKPR